MGRGGGKLNMKLISDERSRKVTFKKRKDGILKKADEFSILCGVDTCLIIYGPKQSDRRPAELYTRPQNPDEVNRIIERFKLNNKPATKTYNLSDWLLEQKGKMDAKIYKLRSDMYETKYPTWDDRIDEFSEHQMEELIHVLDQKIESGKRTLNNVRAVRAPSILLLGGSDVANGTSQKLSDHIYDYAHYHGEYEKEKPSCVGMMDMHMPFSLDQPISYSQMFQYDSNLHSMMTDPLMQYPSTYYDLRRENQMIQSPAENLIMFNGTPSSSMRHEAPLIQKPLSYTPYPMNISSVSTQLGTSEVKNSEDD
ncbi:agamous-like MADS-box protein AGL82 [Argentina anserina]|uniref:agamous-like MADS-box protein AGL82 n=1 Tax=Argentina anserina TaxID=57926 RepID=UPI0021762E5C|nr:agamous-like MADS-box protein AGL82 [Potentilla anserina]